MKSTIQQLTGLSAEFLAKAAIETSSRSPANFDLSLLLNNLGAHGKREPRRAFTRAMNNHMVRWFGG